MDYKYAQSLLKKTKQDYQKIACDFALSRAKPWEELKILVQKYVKKGQQILDVGCGNGRLFLLLKNKEINYTGIDNCRELISLAKERYKNFGNANFYIKDLFNIKFIQKYDLVFAVAVLHHIPSEELRLKAFNNIWESLKKGGIFIMTNWNFFQNNRIKYVEKYNLLKISGKSKLDFNDVFIPWKGYAKNSYKGEAIQRYYHAFTRAEIRNLLEKSKFKVKEIFYVRKGKISDVFEGFNLCVVAQK
jgi:tRNA (uracil-5-)-methyltransferase TRM9